MAVKVVTALQMAAGEARAAEMGVPSTVLMENAGRAVAREVAKVRSARGASSVLVLVGPGNNGGDGLVAARYLREWGVPVAAYLWRRRRGDDVVRQRAEAAGVPLFTDGDDTGWRVLRTEVRRAGVLVDALFGTGLRPPLRADARELLRVTREEIGPRPVVAVDLPSGLDSDSGEADDTALAADLTIALGHLKVGLIVAPGAARAGRIRVVDIGLPPGSEPEAEADVVDEAQVAGLLPPRPAYSHKGTYGKVLVIAGSENYLGAAALACQAAYRIGAGLATLVVPRGLHGTMAAKLTETTFLPVADAATVSHDLSALPEVLAALTGYDALLVGPGLGRRSGTAAFVRALVRRVGELHRQGVPTPTTVLDADALNNLAGRPGWWSGLDGRTIVTPHPGEMGRLLGIPAEDVERDRLGAAQRAADEWNLIVILKGAYTVVAAPGAAPTVSGAATPALATAGSGDVLAGALAGLAAQGMGPRDTATAGVHVHARAGLLAERRFGSAGTVAGDLLGLLPVVLRDLRARLAGSLLDVEEEKPDTYWGGFRFEAD